MHKFEGSRIKVSGRIRERCHPSHRFFTPCHISAFLLSYKAFLSPFRMTIEGESVMMRGTIRRHNEEGTLIVILNECEGSAAVMRKSVKCYSEQERRRLSDYLLLHKVFIANWFYKRYDGG